MPDYIEIEFKNSLTINEYETLLKYFNPDPVSLIKQVNIYFDTNDLSLQKLKMALRARIIDDNKIELTLKQKQPTSVLETTDYITKEALDEFVNNQLLYKGDVSKKLNDLNVESKLFELASLTTYRYEIPYLGNLIALDKSIYYNQIDYEIELETKYYEEGKKVFEDILNKFHIKRKTTKHKITRAYEYKKSLD